MAAVPEIQVFSDSAALVEAAAQLIVREASAAVAAQGRFTLTLAGGSTPRSLYQTLAQPPLRDQVPWQQTLLFWGDERYVSPDHTDSNQRMAREALVSHVHIPSAQVLPFPTSAANPAVDAAAYEATLHAALPDPMPRLDLVLLGMGTDGHTASLFPGTTALNETERLVAATFVAKLDAWRLTMTLPLLNQAALVVFLVTGADKAPAVRTALRPRPATPLPPAGLVRPSSGRLVWMLDSAAAAEIA